VVPLSRQALALLQGQRPETFDHNGLVFCTASGGALGNWDRETKNLYKTTGVLGWHRHDLRRTGATMLGELGVLPDIIESALNHTSIRSPLAAIYNRSRYRPQVAEALQKLADCLERIRCGQP
jgi:integrase